MNELQQEHWPAPALLLLLNVAQAPVGRQGSHPLTGQPPCQVLGRGEWYEEMPVAAFDPATWQG